MRRLASHSCSVASLRPRHGGFGRRLVRGAIFALACLAGVGLSAGERSSARADDGGMMSFLLNGNGGAS